MWRAIRQVLSLFLAVSIGVLLSGGVASAGMVTIWPDQFSVDNYEGSGSPATYQSPDQLRGAAHYYYVLKIPGGKIVKFIRVNYNNPEGVGYTFCVSLKRKTPSTLAETLIEFCPDPALVGTTSMQSDATHVSGPLKVQSGYRYYILIEPGLEPGSFNSVQVVYN